MSLLSRQISTLENETQQYKTTLRELTQSNEEYQAKNDKIQKEAQKFYQETAEAQQQAAAYKHRAGEELERLRDENEELKQINDNQLKDIHSLQANVAELAEQNAQLSMRQEEWERATQQSTTEIAELSKELKVNII